MSDYMNGLPPELQGPAEDVEGAIQETKDALNEVGETELELAGPEEMIDAPVQGETGSPARRVRHPYRKAHRVKAKRAHTAPSSSGGSDLSARVQRVEQSLTRTNGAFTRFVSALKRGARFGAFRRTAGTGNRGFYACTVANVAAAGNGTSTAVVGNADTEYDRVAFVSNTPGLISAFTAAGNPIIEGSATIALDSGVVIGPFELAEEVKLNGNGGVTVTFANRGAAAGDATVLFIPKGANFGSQPMHRMAA